MQLQLYSPFLFFCCSSFFPWSWLLSRLKKTAAPPPQRRGTSRVKQPLVKRARGGSSHSSNVCAHRIERVIQRSPSARGGLLKRSRLMHKPIKQKEPRNNIQHSSLVKSLILSRE